MKYLSTRDDSIRLSGAQAIVKGLSADGGLFVPESFARLTLDDIGALVDMTYVERAARILGLFLDDFSADELKKMASDAYDGKFEGGRPAPVKTLDARTHVMELSHGPTCAFKDMALQLLPRLMVASKRKLGDNRRVCILAATSGDTGKAALEGFRDVEGTQCVVFYPHGGVSPTQRLQMVTQRGNNVDVVAVRGNFDDTQRGVKRIFGDAEAKARVEAMGCELSSANSINFGRLAPQIAYYFSAYADLVARGEISLGDEIEFAVPTGNFGNILAGIYAKWMGLPVKRFICCSNRNKVLDDFLRTGVYDVRREFFKTTSPSMDILISSNLERLLFEMSGRDAARVRGWMDELMSTGMYRVDDDTRRRMDALLSSGWADDDAVAAEIKRTWNEHNYLMDTHTAVAMRVMREYRERACDATPCVVVSTASPFKFSADVLHALKGADVPADPFKCADELESLSGERMPEQLRELKSLPVLHSTVTAPEGMEQAVLNAISEKNQKK